MRMPLVCRLTCGQQDELDGDIDVEVNNPPRIRRQSGRTCHRAQTTRNARSRVSIQR